MKILYIIDNLIRGGKERQLVELSRNLCKIHQVELVVFSDDIQYKEILSANIKLHYLKKSDRKSFAASKKIITICSEFKPDLIHAWDHLSAVMAIPAKILFSIKLIDSIRYAAERKRFQGSWYITGLAFRFSNRVIANSKAGLQSHRKAINKKYRVIYNGFDFQRLESGKSKNELKTEMQIQTEFVVGKVANFLKSKDYKTLINAGIKLLEKRQDVSFVFVGDGPTRSNLESLVPIKLKPYFKFLGKRNDVEKIISIFDIGVLLSNTYGHAEGISNALTEIMVQSVPVIATNAGGNPELIENSKSGFLINSFAEGEFLEKLELLLANEELRFEMGNDARLKITNQFGMKRMNDEYENTYQELVSAN